MRRFAIVCLTFSITFLMLMAGLVLLRRPEPTLNTKFRELKALKADLARLDMDFNRISRGAKTVGATSDETPEGTETPEEQQPEADEQAQPEAENPGEGQTGE